MANFYTDNPDLRHHLTHPLMEKIVALKERNYTDAEKYDYAPLDYADAQDSYDKVLEIVGEICGDIIAPNAEDVEHQGPSVADGRVIYADATKVNLDACRKAGLMGMAMPRRYGGLNFPITPYIMAADIVSRADTGFENLWGLQDCAETIYEFAEQPDGTWRLNGVKRFITNGDSDIHLVLARSEAGTKDGRGLSMFIYDKRDGGVNVRRIENKMGIKGSPTCELTYKNAKAELCGSRRMGLIKYVMALMNGARLGIAAQSVGVSELAYREALAYARDRKQFGKAIIEFPAVYEMLSVMKAKLDASRSLLYECARFVDMYKVYDDIAKERSLTPEERKESKMYSRQADALTPLAKGMGSEYCNQNAYDCIQIHGGSGFMKDYACERLYRDARITSIYEGTTQLQVVAAIRHVTTGTYQGLINSYLENDVKPELQSIKERIRVMAEVYAKAVETVGKVEDQAYGDFMARRLVEMAGVTVMSCLLMLDAERNDSFRRSAEVYLNLAQAEVTKHAEFINTFDPEKVAEYKVM